MPERQHPPHDVATALKIARLTNNSDLSSVLVEFAAEMASQGLASAATIKQLEDEIAVIRAGMRRLDSDSVDPKGG